MNSELKQALKVITEKCKQPDYYEQMNAKSLSNRVYSLKCEFLHFVDKVTLNYLKTQQEKEEPGCWSNHYVHTELTKREKDKAIEEMKWLIKDIEACISHLKK